MSNHSGGERLDVHHDVWELGHCRNDATRPLVPGGLTLPRPAAQLSVAVPPTSLRSLAGGKVRRFHSPTTLRPVTIHTWGKASAPASVANLGAGFDCLALALELRCTVEAHPATDWEVVSSDPDGLIAGVARRAVGLHVPMRISVKSEIPVGKGLGSSAAVTVATIAACNLALGHDPIPAEVFQLASELEGHPDNAAAAVYGGLALTTAARIVRNLSVSPELVVTVAVPQDSLPTHEARAALPAQVSLEAAARSVARGIALIEGLRTGDRQLLAEANGDELHEPHRMALRSVIGKLGDAARTSGAWLTTLAGAGPSVLVISDAGSARAVAKAMAAAASNVTILRPGISAEGLRWSASDQPTNQALQRDWLADNS